MEIFLYKMPIFLLIKCHNSITHWWIWMSFEVHHFFINICMQKKHGRKNGPTVNAVSISPFRFYRRGIKSLIYKWKLYISYLVSTLVDFVIKFISWDTTDVYKWKVCEMIWKGVFKMPTIILKQSSKTPIRPNLMLKKYIVIVAYTDVQKYNNTFPHVWQYLSPNLLIRLSTSVSYMYVSMYVCNTFL